MDQKLTDLLDDFAAAAQWVRQCPEDAEGVEEMHRTYRVVADFLRPGQHERVETVTDDNHRIVLVYRGLDLVEVLDIEL